MSTGQGLRVWPFFVLKFVLEVILSERGAESW